VRKSIFFIVALTSLLSIGGCAKRGLITTQTDNVNSSIVGIWQGYGTEITSKSVTLANGNISKAIQRGVYTFDIREAQDGMCIYDLKWKNDSSAKIGANYEGKPMNSRDTKNHVCTYTKTHLILSTNIGAVFYCNRNHMKNNMLCFYVRSQPFHQSVIRVKMFRKGLL